jgi:hypothetical protein
MLFPQTRLPGLDNGLGAVGDLQLVKNVGNVVADRFGADVELLGDLLIVFPLGDALKDLALAVS